MLGELARRLRYLVLRDRYTAELEEEIRTHIAHRAASLQADGLSAGEASYEARRRFGNPITLQERSRDMWGFSLFDDLAADLRFAARRLRMRPGFSAATILVAALGIGATTAVFSAIDAAFLRPLGFPNPSELHYIKATVPFSDPRVPPPPGLRHRANTDDMAAMTDVFSRVAVYAAGALNLTDREHPVRVNAGVVSHDFFATFGARLQAGRTFDSSETRPKGGRVAILSDGLWRTQFGARDVIGKSIDLSGNPYTVIGVMAPGFDFPNRSELWIPLTNPTTFDSFSAFRGYLPTRVVGRARPALSADAVSNRVTARWAQLAGASIPGDPNSQALDEEIAKMRAEGGATPLREMLVGKSRAALTLLMSASVLLLLVACANVANLLLADAAGRRREMALREVLGASRGRVARQLLVESLLLAISGGLLGVALAPTVLGLLQRLMPRDLAGIASAELDLRVLAFAALLSTVSALVVGLWPALSLTRRNASETIKLGGGLGATAAGMGRTRQTIIVVEIALTIVLLVGAGLMMRSFEKVVSQERGIDANHVATLELSLQPGRGNADQLTRLHAMLAQLQNDPAIEAAAIVSDLPLNGAAKMSLGITANGMPAPKLQDGAPPMARYIRASGDYFKTLGIPLLRGRTFTTADDANAPPVAIINMAMAKTWWPDRDPIGQTFVTAARAPVTVIGIVGDLRERTLEGEAPPQMYFSIDDAAPGDLALIARSSLPSDRLLARLRAVVRTVDPSQPVFNVRMMDDVVDTSVAPRRTNTLLIALFGGVALLLSSFGIYAVVSHSVTRRGREFGIRAALGATAADIARLVGRELVALVGLGVAIGLAAAWVLSRVLTALLYGVAPHDPMTFIIVPAVLAVPAIFAGWSPTRRAMRANPMEVMRAE